VDSAAITAMAIATGSHARSQKLRVLRRSDNLTNQGSLSVDD
jgi:hypothetical protein